MKGKTAFIEMKFDLCTIISNLENLANYILWPVSYKKYILNGFQVDFGISKMSFIVCNVINLFEISQ